jgi:hypothetical protein
MLRDDVRNINTDDGAYHINDLGHRMLFQRALNKQLFAANIPLPLKLITFHGFFVNDGVELKWSTTQEEGNTSFEVQRSIDGIAFETKSKRPGSGIAQSASYSWTDMSALPGRNFYRLKITELDRLSYSDVISVLINKKAVAIQKIYTINNLLMTEISIDKKQAVVVSIINTGGSVMHRELRQLDGPVQKISLPIGALATGLYYLNINTAEGDRISSPFLKK